MDIAAMQGQSSAIPVFADGNRATISAGASRVATSHPAANIEILSGELFPVQLVIRLMAVSRNSRFRIVGTLSDLAATGTRT